MAWATDSQTIRARNATAVFVSEEIDPPEALSQISSAMVVRCTLPKDEKGRLKRASEIVCAWGVADMTTAGVLVKRVNFDLRDALAVMQKAALFPEARLTVGAIEALASRRVEEDVVWSLVALNKRAAIEAVTEGGETQVGWIIGTLASHVEALSRINATLSTNPTIRDVAQRTGLHEQYVRNLISYARLYPRKEAVRRTLLLNRLDNSYQSGAHDGILESLIALW